MMFKSLNGLAPVYLQDLFRKRHTDYDMRDSLKMQLSFSLYEEKILAFPDRPLRCKAFPNEGTFSESQFFLGAVAFSGIIGIAGKIYAS